jgi:hypothetical protein
MLRWAKRMEAHGAPTGSREGGEGIEIRKGIAGTNRKKITVADAIHGLRADWHVRIESTKWKMEPNCWALS